MDMKVNSKKIIALRKQNVWSQQHLSDVSGVSLRTIQRVENNSSASYETLKALAAGFGLEASKLVDNSDSPAAPFLRSPAAKAMGVCAFIISIVGGMLLVPDETNATALSIQSKSIVDSKDDISSEFKDDVVIDIPEHMKYTINNEDDVLAEEKHADYNAVMNVGFGTLLVSDHEVRDTPSGIQIITEKARWIKPAPSS